MFVGQKIQLWQYFLETLQCLVHQEYLLTITAELGDGKYAGTLEDGTAYFFENGTWWAESSEGPSKLEMAVDVWNTAMRSREWNLRVIKLPSGDNIVPTGDVEKCETHNRYYFSRGSCVGCRVDAHRS
jgi:hypothetical protein